MEKWGNDEAFEIDVKVWERAQLWEMKAVSKAFNIQGNDVTTLVKYMRSLWWTKLLSGRTAQKAIFLPSGDQLGPEEYQALLLRLVCSEPSAFITYTWGVSSRHDVKAILLPSGDHAGK